MKLQVTYQQQNVLYIGVISCNKTILFYFAFQKYFKSYLKTIKGKSTGFHLCIALFSLSPLTIFTGLYLFIIDCFKYSSPMPSLVPTGSLQLTSDSQHLGSCVAHFTLLPDEFR
uniref:Uncharacterized protein n=1 Tax=Timema monikensis TaxID=170555 RepID=A0A7R9E7Z4_9NEOP|nr:unnamed protein product [Timema monikensis]